MLALAVALGLAVAAVPPAPTHWVEDHAGLMSEPARVALDARLQAYEHASGHQVVVWIGKTLDGAPLDDWAVRTFGAWAIGREGLDDGVAIFVLADDRAIDIEVGYGLEGDIPDATASRIIHDVMAPRLQAKDPDGAITAGANAVVAAIEAVEGPGSASPPPAPADSEPTTIEWVVGGVALALFLVLFITHPRWFLWLGLLLGRGFMLGRGGGGGFGGRGGRSGGGGARGKW